MGLPLTMENMHAPTIPSGPTSGTSGPGSKVEGASLLELQAKKDNIEAELKALSGVLTSHGVNMNTPLITPDGFPRADLDVAQIRTTRTRIIYLKNDYKALMAHIEKKIHEHFASQVPLDPLSTSTGSSQSSEVHGLASRSQLALDTPFAKVNSVVTGSPAHEAGMKAGDQIRNFGYVNAGNHDGLKRVADCVQGNEGHTILVKVSRSSVTGSEKEELQLNLLPRRGWGGRGLLGCHILLL